MDLTPDILLRAYRSGIFPMGDPDADTIRWYAPDPRAVLPLEGFHVPKTLGKLVRQERFDVVADRDFEAVIRYCADRERTWITDEIIEGYTALHRVGYAHSMECWQDGTLAGGLYGVAIGGAFFGESMFYHVANASKVALVHLVRRMRRHGYQLLDTQFSNPHLKQFGVVEIPRAEYERRLGRALTADVGWQGGASDASDLF